MSLVFFCEGYGDHRDLHVLTHSFPTRRSSDLSLSGRAMRRALTSMTRSTPSAVTRLRWKSHSSRSRAITSPGRRRVSSSFHRSEEHTSELQSLMRISYAVFCLKKKNNIQHTQSHSHNSLQIIHLINLIR